MTEWVLDYAIPITPEHVFEGHLDLGCRAEGTFEGRIDILHASHQE
jgi:hypothetical protein